MRCVDSVVLFVSAAVGLSAGSAVAIPFPYVLELQARANTTGSSTFNLPVGSTIFDHTADLSDARHVTARISTNSSLGRQGIFFGQFATGGIVYEGPNNTFLSDPVVNASGLTVYRVTGAGIRRYDPAGPTESLYTFGLPGTSAWETPRINNAGQVVFRGTTAASRSVDLYDPQTNTTQRFVAEPGLDPGSPFNFIFSPALNNSGQVAVKLQRGPSTSADEVHLFTAPGVSTVVAAETGADPNAAFTSIDNSVNVNDLGRVVFAATPVGGPRGVFVVDGTTAPQVIAQAQPGFVIDFFTPDISNSGLVVFRATEGGVAGIYVGDGVSIQRVAFVGQSVTTDLGTTTITNFSQNPRINAAGDISFTAGLASGGRGVFIAVIPEPAALSLLAVAGLTLRRRR